MFSKAAQIVAAMETDWALPGRPSDIESQLQSEFRVAPDQLRVFGEAQWTAPVASGSGAPSAMVICPCTTGTLASIAQGGSDNLIERAADVIIKERRQLIVLPREMPLSPIHLENMLKLARLGVTIMPPNPGFYNSPRSVEDLIDFVVARVLDQLGIEHRLMPVWGETE